MAAAALFAAALLWIFLSPSVAATADPSSVRLVALGTALLAAEWWPLSLWIRGQAIHTTLSGVGIALGVIFVGPLPTLLLRLVTGGIGLRLRWGNSWQKLRYNLVSQILEVYTVTAVFMGIAGDADLLSLRLVVGAVLALIAGDLVSILMVLLVIRLSVGPLRKEMLYDIGIAAAASMAIAATSAVIGARLLAADIGSAVAFTGVLSLLIATNRSRHTLHTRYRSATDLYSFMESIQGVASADTLMEKVLAEAKEITGARKASILLGIEGTAVRMRLEDASLLIGEDVEARTADRLGRKAAVGLIVEEGAQRPCPEILGERGEQMMLSSFVHDHVSGVIILEGRQGSMPKFDSDDLAVANALARHAGVAIASSRVLDKLRMRTHQLERAALYDPQTGLHNHEGLVESCPQLSRGTVVVLEMLDLEDIETAFGHGLSEEAAVAVADQLRAIVADRPVHLARLAPSRFGVVLEGVEHRLDARKEISLLRAALRGPLGGTHLHLEARFAFAAAQAPDHGRDTAELLRRATTALAAWYRSPNAEIAWFAPDLDLAATARLELASDLRQALDAEELTLAYQPKVDLRTGRVTGVEVLARWAHPVRGYVSPADFIEVAEQTGLIHPLTQWVVATAARQAATWQEAGWNIGVAVNLSTVIMEDRDTARQIIDACSEAGLPNNLLTVEITESQMMGDLERGSGILARLHATGMRVSVDDFGTGYSSLAQLKDLPVNEVKIDRSFVTNMASDGNDRALTEAIVRMSKALSLHVVAEGIEDSATVDLLVRMGCDSGQGFHLHRPMAALDIDQLLAGQHGVDRAQGRVVPLRRNGP